MASLARILPVFALGVSAAIPTGAAKIHVPADIPTVREALSVATAGDTVMVAAGVYIEPGPSPTVPYGVAVIGSGDWMPGFECTDCTYFVSFGVDTQDGPEGVLVENIWFTTFGIVADNPRTTIRHCRFGAGGGDFEDYRVIRLQKGGTVEDCFAFTASEPYTQYGIQISGGTARIVNNVLAIKAMFGLLDVWEVFPLEEVIIRNNTFGIGTAEIRFDAPGVPITFVNNITTEFQGVACWPGSEPYMAHNNFTAGLGSTNCTLADSNIVADPWHCGDIWIYSHLPENYYLHASSPCVGTGENGSNIGAWGVGCGVSGVAANEAPLQRLNLTVRPNPVLNGAQFTLDADEKGLALEIYDPTGRLVELLNPNGPITWRPEEGARSGVYFARLTGSKDSEVVKFVVLR